MRTAILFYGYARTFGQLIGEYKLAIPPNADIFIQTYDTFYAVKSSDHILSSDFITYTTLEYFRPAFGDRIKYFANPSFDDKRLKKLVADKNIPEVNSINQHAFRTYAFFENMKKVIEAKQAYEKQHNFTYDAVILTRLDLILNSKLLIPEDLTKLSYPMGTGYWPNFKRKIGAAAVFGTNPLQCLNDQILIANSPIIDKIAEIFDKIHDYYKEGILINNETLVGMHMNKCGIKFSPDDFVSYVIFR